MTTAQARRELAEKLVAFKHGQMIALELVDYIEGFISTKVDEIIRAREDMRRALGKPDAQNR